ncbi:MAG: hypothetical protein R3B49_11215 [Phycisphaerales bacterium]
MQTKAPACARAVSMSGRVPSTAPPAHPSPLASVVVMTRRSSSATSSSSSVPRPERPSTTNPWQSSTSRRLAASGRASRSPGRGATEPSAANTPSVMITTGDPAVPATRAASAGSRWR